MYYKIVSTSYTEPKTFYGDTEGIETLRVESSGRVYLYYHEHGFYCEMSDEGVQELIDFWENRMLVQDDDSVPF